ncbi:MAG: hypothetical protein HY795_14615 [Desulfovibrio sp.]|nr:hypothetical protein [Desulfovibrio sp.]MBI4961002.1 hypothetical protein [Desulfovibrio sp.]
MPADVQQHFEIIMTHLTNIDYLSWMKVIVGPLAGAFIGAYSAFRWTIRKEELKTVGDNKASGDFVIFTIIQQYSLLKSIKKELDGVRDKQYKYLQMDILNMVDYSNVVIDYKTLSFLINTENHIVMGRLSGLEKSFHLFINNIKEFNAINLQLQKLAIQIKDKVWYDRTLDEIDKMLPKNIVAQASSLVDEIYEMEGKLLKNIPSVAVEFHEILKKKYPDHQFIPLPTYFTKPITTQEVNSDEH